MAWRRPGDKPLSEAVLVSYWRINASLGLNALNENRCILILYISLTSIVSGGELAQTYNTGDTTLADAMLINTKGIRPELVRQKLSFSVHSINSRWREWKLAKSEK